MQEIKKKKPLKGYIAWFFIACYCITFAIPQTRDMNIQFIETIIAYGGGFQLGGPF